MAQRLRICHLYPDLMDTYGDKGNIITLIKRCQWRGIEATVSTISVGDKLDSEKYDIYFFGGGQDRAQLIVGKDLKSKAKALKEAVERGATLLSICGGYQLLQNYFKTLNGIVIEGIGLFDAHTIGSTTRMIQNLLVELNPNLQNEIKDHKYLVGFENHSGKTYLGKTLQPLGKVLKGAGNNGEDGTEGAVYKNAFGCYLHGSLLPKNPHFADFLISKALTHKNNNFKLKPLNNDFEWQAHHSAVGQIS